MAFEEPAGSGRDRTVWPEASRREREQPEPQGAARVTVTLVCAGLGERVKALLLGEEGSEDGVLCDDDGARVVGVVVVPSEEAVTRDGVVGGEGGRFAVEEGAAAVDIAIGVACLDDDLELFGGGEVGGEGGVLSEEDAARVVGVAVVPAEEAVAEPGHGADFDVGEVGVGAVAHGVAHERVGRRAWCVHRRSRRWRRRVPNCDRSDV